MEVAPEGRNVGPACPCKRVVNEEVVQDRVPELNTHAHQRSRLPTTKELLQSYLDRDAVVQS